MKDLHEHVFALGEGQTHYSYDKPDASLLECFPSPFSIEGMNPAHATGSLLIVCPEFTSLCPKTGQPDFATIKIEYTPDLLCVESKSLKLYLGSFRNHGEFHESCVNRICNDLVALLAPICIKVTGEFTPRGGIPFWPTAYWEKGATLADKHHNCRCSEVDRLFDAVTAPLAALLKPAWALGPAAGYTSLGAVLPTRDGSICGNATLVDSEDSAEFGQLFVVLTDAGNMSRMTEAGLEERFYKPEWRVKPEDALGWTHYYQRQGR